MTNTPKFKTTTKRAISPVAINISLVATRVNENGTLSGFEQIVTTGPKGTAPTAKSSNQSGGAIWVSVDTLKGLKVMADTTDKATGPKTKLF